MKVLSEFIHSFDFVRMKPDDSVIKEGVPDGGAARALVDPGKAIAIYVRKPSLRRNQRRRRPPCKSSSQTASGAPSGSP